MPGRKKSNKADKSMKDLLAERKKLEMELIVSGLKALISALNEQDMRAVLWLLERHPRSPFRKDAPVEPAGKVAVSFAPLDGEEAGDD